MKKERKAKNLTEVSAQINLTSTIVSTSTADVSNKIMDFSTLKNKHLLHNGKSLLFSNGQ